MKSIKRTEKQYITILEENGIRSKLEHKRYRCLLGTILCALAGCIGHTNPFCWLKNSVAGTGAHACVGNMLRVNTGVLFYQNHDSFCLLLLYIPFHTCYYVDNLHLNLRGCHFSLRKGK
jgi:hypothetical protein